MKEEKKQNNFTNSDTEMGQGEMTFVKILLCLAFHNQLQALTPQGYK